MTDTLEFPHGVRLARLDEIPGSESERSETWDRVQHARIEPGFTFVTTLPAERFRFYAEINVNASEIWAIFHDLCATLLRPEVTLVASESDEYPVSIASADLSLILSILEHYRYQLAHDGFLQFGLLCADGDEIAEVFLAPTKHFKVWLNDEPGFRSVMERYHLAQRETMTFIDEFPRVTERLGEDRGVFLHGEELWQHLSRLIEDAPVH